VEAAGAAVEVEAGVVVAAEVEAAESGLTWRFRRLHPHHKL
jgi:hypothetical protein